MNFEVEADDLDSYAVQVGRAAEDMQAAGQYVQKNGSISMTEAGLVPAAVEGIFQLIVGPHGAVLQEVKSAMNGAEGVLRAAQGELSKSASYYRATDTSSAASLDATYPPSKR